MLFISSSFAGQLTGAIGLHTTLGPQGPLHVGVGASAAVHLDRVGFRLSGERFETLRPSSRYQARRMSASAEVLYTPLRGRLGWAQQDRPVDVAVDLGAGATVGSFLVPVAMFVDGNVEFPYFPEYSPRFGPSWSVTPRVSLGRVDLWVSARAWTYLDNKPSYEAGVVNNQQQAYVEADLAFGLSIRG